MSGERARREYWDAQAKEAQAEAERDKTLELMGRQQRKLVQAEDEAATLRRYLLQALESGWDICGDCPSNECGEFGDYGLTPSDKAKAGCYSVQYLADLHARAEAGEGERGRDRWEWCCKEYDHCIFETGFVPTLKEVLARYDAHAEEATP